jgi:hypothetical protein
MPEPGDLYASAFIVEPMQCWRMVHAAGLQADHCPETPSWTGRWFPPRGDMVSGVGVQRAPRRVDRPQGVRGSAAVGRGAPTESGTSGAVRSPGRGEPHRGNIRQPVDSQRGTDWMTCLSGDWPHGSWFAAWDASSLPLLQARRWLRPTLILMSIDCRLMVGSPEILL